MSWPFDRSSELVQLHLGTAMSVTPQLLPTISALVALGEFAQQNQLNGCVEVETVSDRLPVAVAEQRAEREWRGAIAALTQLLIQQTSLPQDTASAHRSTHHQSKTSSKTSGKSRSPKSSRSKSPCALAISGPVPLLENPLLETKLSNWTFVPQSSEQLASAFQALSPVERLFQQTFKKQSHKSRLLPLLEEDPLAKEQFTLVLTPHFSIVLVLGKDADDELRFQFSFMPQVVMSVWRILRSRIRTIRPQQLEFIDPLVEQFAPKEPNYRIVSQFNRWLLAYLPQPDAPDKEAADDAPMSQTQVQSDGQSYQTSNRASDRASDRASEQLSDSDLLKAMAHEIRTPLTTIRTFTRSLLKRDDLDERVIKRLQSIDRECTQQIDRFSLIFRAVELEAASQSPKSPLSAIALHQVFQAAIPQWQKAAQRRNISLEVGVPSELPMVASDPTMLQHVLTGLVELFTHSVSPGSHIELHVANAGEKLKLQFQSHGDPERTAESASCSPPPLQSLGHLLMFQPETGGLSLNLEATKNLFNALGAKLTVRERSNKGTTWTVYLPLESSGLTSCPIV